MSELRIGINGFGRIGRAITRILLARKRHQVVHVNDTNPDIANLAYLLKYDTTYGRLGDAVTADGDAIAIGDRKIRVSHQHDIAEVDWQDVDVVIEATGVGRNEAHARALLPQLRSVLVTHACPSADFTLVFGATDHAFDPVKHRLVSTSICDAAAAAPVLKVLHEAFGIDYGFVTTLHPWLSYQNLMDGPARSQALPGSTYAHYPLGRASVGALIPKPTTVVSACERIVPELAGILKCMSYRVPTACVSSADLSLHLERTASEDGVLAALHALRASQHGREVVRITDEPLISVDYLGDPHSCIVDTRWLMLNRGRQLKVVLWYDNEWGYSSRVADALDLVAR
ncbi:MAG TPA: glyceraldehyde 3-phosphate dehydrogenase NAD-binding domain-containing protein [Kofleriaceae bacterium]|nr:glyceraldehyde 3-phosphate dehydrogenase NAD-binding domain-containing protein [Kofleriaceae bacterium]